MLRRAIYPGGILLDKRLIFDSVNTEVFLLKGNNIMYPFYFEMSLTSIYVVITM